MDQPTDTLRDVERDILWMASQGLPAREIARAHLMDEGSVKNLYWRVSRKLGTRNLTHSVALALTRGIIGPYRDCGSRRSYLRHLRRQESACVACRRANTACVTQQRDTERPDTSPLLTPTQLLVVRTLEPGRTQAETAARLDMDPRRVASHMSQVYQRLGITHLYRYDRLPVALRMLRERGILGDQA